MIQESITIINKLGLHARASSKLVTLCSKFSSLIELQSGTKTVNAKSIMGVMMLAAAKGTTLTLHIDGPDEVQAREAIVNLVNNYFGEGG